MITQPLFTSNMVPTPETLQLTGKTLAVRFEYCRGLPPGLSPISSGLSRDVLLCRNSNVRITMYCNRKHMLCIYIYVRMYSILTLYIYIIHYNTYTSCTPFYYWVYTREACQAKPTRSMNRPSQPAGTSSGPPTLATKSYMKPAAAAAVGASSGHIQLRFGRKGVD